MFIDRISSKKIVVLHIITGLSTGGAEMMLYKLMSKTNRLRFDPIVVSLIDRGTFGDRIESLGIPVYTMGMTAGIATPAAIWKLVCLVRKLQPDLIQGWMYHANLAAQLASGLCLLKTPVLWSIHHSISSLASEKSLTIKIIRWCAYLSRLTARVVYVSQASKLQHEALGYNRNNNSVIPNGFDTSLLLPSLEDKLEVKAELGLPEKTTLIGAIGRYHPMKDHANFLQAAALLLKTYPDVHFLLIGTKVDRQNTSLIKLIEELNIGDRVHLLGERTDIPRLTAALDISTVASAYGEAFPLVVGEAMSCGVPCVVTDVGDSAWIVSNTGKVVAPKNPQALANAWKELIALDEEERETLGKSARSRIVEFFSLDSVVTQYENLYESALTANKRK
ncbi:glycosyltransferase [Microcoleus sp. Pol11C3]|uniref:glycosyltransferase n=1 Tax=Microcoleus sp. Pol11C3 TaxID=3055390 RepID=UPI002FD0CBE3